MNEISQIKELRDKQNLTFTEIALRLGLDRKTVTKWYKSKDFPKYERKVASPAPVAQEIVPYLKIWIAEDVEAIKKGKIKKIRPASTMYHQLKDLGIVVDDSTVRKYVRELKPNEAFIPLEHEPGESMQVDWGEIWVQFTNNIRIKVHLFVATLPYSNARYAYPYWDHKWISFVDGHIKAFDFFGGIPNSITYDNLSSAVKKVLKGTNRVEQDKMLHFKNSYNFTSNYCNVAKGNEKGSVENGVGYFKRRFLSTQKVYLNWEELCHYLEESSFQLLNQKHYKKKQDIKDLLKEEDKSFSKIPAIPFHNYIYKTVKVSKTCLVSYDGVQYSVPCEYVSKPVKLKVTLNDIKLYNNQYEEIAKHPITHKAFCKEVIDFKHYLNVLKSKPRALNQARCIKAYQFPKIFWDYLKKLNESPGNGNREMIEILMLSSKYTMEDIFFALNWCYEHRTFSYIAVKMTLSELHRSAIVPQTLDISYPTEQKSTLDLTKYDQLLGGCQ